MLTVKCPKCGGEIHEQYKQFQCAKCDFAVWKTLCSRMFEPEEVEKLITEKQIGPLQGFRSKQGFPFAAVLKMNAEHKIEFDFGNGQTKDGVDAMAQTAYDVNRRDQNIGARRLYTILERVFETISFEAPDAVEKNVCIDAAYVKQRLADVVKDEDLSKFIL